MTQIDCEEEEQKKNPQTIGIEELEASVSKPVTEVINGLRSDGVALFELGDRH